MAGTTAYDGACACGGLIEASPSDALTREQERILEALGEGFMEPQFTNGTFCYVDEDACRAAGIWCPDGSCWVPIAYCAVPDECVTDRREGWFYRLSAPGYMDCTDWSGPYASEVEAARACVSEYGDDVELEEEEES